MRPTKNKIPKIMKFSFFTLFTLNKIKIPIPEFTNKPAIIPPTLMIFPRYNCVNMTEEAQFGIKPIKLVIKGPIKLFL